MNQRTRNQWIEKAKEQLLKNERRTDANVRDLLFLYDEAAAACEKEINTMFVRYAKDNQLTSAEARQLLSGKEYNVWKKSIKEYISAASGEAQNSKAMLELNTLAAKSRISRQEALLSNIYQNMIDLAEDNNTKLEVLLGDMLKINYKESCYRIQQGFGMGFQVAKINQGMLNQILSHPWSERHFSEAVWGHCDHLAALARRELTMGFIRGSSVQQMAKSINEVMDKGRYAVDRLVRTECKYFANQGELIGYKENGIKKYRFIGGSESSSHCDCADLNDQEFAVTDAAAGINYPPIHPNCLCIVIAVFDKSLFDNRAADPLPSKISFERWDKKYGG